MGDGTPFWSEGFWANGFWHPDFWGAEAVPGTPGKVVCLTGRDRSVTTLGGAHPVATLTGRDRSVTTLTADLDC